MYKFGQIKIASNQFYNVYQIASDVNLEKIRVSEGVVAIKHDIKYVIGYEIEPGNIIPLYIKTPKNCICLGVTLSLKMRFNVSKDADWVTQYINIWEKVEELISQKLTGKPLINDIYINSKLIIARNGNIKTQLSGNSWYNFNNNIKTCYATGVLKIGNIYRHGINYQLQVFLKEFKYKESQLSDEE